MATKPSPEFVKALDAFITVVSNLAREHHGQVDHAGVYDAIVSTIILMHS